MFFKILNEIRALVDDKFLQIPLCALVDL